MVLKSLTKILTIKDNYNWKFLIFFLFAAYAFSFVVRLIWVYMFSDNPSFFWDGQLMINTNDGYFWAEGARDILAGPHQPNDSSPVNSPTSILTAFIATIVPFSLDTLILYMPTIFGSLLVVPVVLIGRVLGMSSVGFVAALLAGIVWSYYNRTMTGYYDTDLLIVVLPALLTWAMIEVLRSKKYLLLPLAPVLAMLASYWHSGGMHISNALFYMAIFYVIVFDKKDKFNYKALSVYAIALFSFPVWAKLVLIFGLSGVFYYFREKLQDKALYALLGIVALAFLVFGGINWVLSIMSNAYIVRVIVADELNLSLKYFGVVNTVREAGQIPFETFANRISGHTFTLFFSALGYVLMLVRYPIMILTLPMIGLGFFAVQGGLRFTVFAVPFMALGGAYLLFVIAKLLPAWPRIALIAAGSAAALYPNITHIQNYKVPTVFNKQEVEVLDRLHGIADREDYVVTWWDYGYPIRYYSDVKTIVDGGRHDGGSNFPVSFALTYPDSLAAARMMRLDVEYLEKSFRQKCSRSIECMMQDYGYQNPNEFIKALQQQDFNMPEKTRDAYLYLPLRMMEIFPTVKLFSNLDLLTGQQFPRPFFYYTTSFKEANGKIELGGGIRLHKQGGLLEVGQQQVQLNSFYVTAYDNSGKLQVQQQKVNPNGPISVIFMRSYNAFLVVDQNMFNSTYVQMFVLENYDKELYEPVINTPLVKVYKLKI